MGYQNCRATVSVRKGVGTAVFKYPTVGRIVFWFLVSLLFFCFLLLHRFAQMLYSIHILYR